MLRMPSHARLILSLLVLSICATAWPAAAADLKLSSSSLSFVAVSGSTTVAPQGFTAYSSPASSGFSPIVTPSTQSGGQWLAVSSAAGGSFAGSVDVKVSVNPAGLAVGDYSGTVTVSQSGFTGSPATVAVSLKVIQAAPYLAASPSSMTFSTVAGADPAAGSLQIYNAGAGTIKPTLTATTSNGSNWLVVSQPTVGSFSNATTVLVQVKAAALPPGTYNGTISVASSGALNTPLNVPVKLTVGGATAPTISVSPSSLSFVAGLGAGPRIQGLTLNNTGAGTLKATVTSTGGSWLLVSQPIGGSFGSTSAIQVKADITGLSKATYSGNITVSDPASTNGSVTVPVQLTLSDPQPVLSVPISWIGFSTPTSSTQALKSAIYLENIGTGAMPWTATYSSDANWLTIDNTADVAAFGSAVTIIANPWGLAAGIYNGQITFSAPTAVAGATSVTVKVTLAVGANLPAPANNGIVNGASFASNAVAPGSIISIFGRSMGPTAGVQNFNIVNGKLPSQLGGVQVLFNYTDSTGSHSVPAPLYYAADGQINAQVPVELAGLGSATVQVVYNNVPSPTVVLNLKSADPGVFGGYTGGQPIICFNNSTTLVSAQNPAKAGDYLVIYATGLGMAYNGNSALPTGAPAPVDATRLYTVKDPVTVTIGGTTVPALFAGLTPGFVGLYQVNFQVPSTVASGPNSMILSVGQQQTAPLTLSLR